MSVERIPDDMFADARRAVEVMKKGGVILYPTDTIWGLGCDASNPEAVARLYKIKERADSKPMLVLVDSVSSMERIIPNVPEIAYDLIEAAVDPMTIIYDSAKGVAPSLLGADGSLGVRVTREPFSATLCRGLRRPVVSTSANKSGMPSALVFSDIDNEIIEAVDYVCTSRRDEKNPGHPSGIIRLGDGGLFKIIR